MAGIGSSLLHLVRSGKILQANIFDKELNIGVLAEDISDKFVDQLEKDFPFFTRHSDDLRKDHLVFFGPDYDKDISIWASPVGFTLMVKFWKGTNIIYEYGGNGVCLVWPDYHLNDKSKWGSVEYLGRKFNTPAKPKEWLAHYFGEDWETPKLKWSWILDAKNIKYTDILKKEGEIC